MDTVVVIEVLDRFGKVRERHRLDHFPFMIGRSYHNDLILDDAYVSPEHLVIDLDETGNPVARDNDSTNGLFSLHPLQPHRCVAIEDNTRIRIGHTDLRFRFPNHPVKETVVERNKPSRLVMFATNTLLLPLVWAVTAAILFGLGYVTATDKVVTNALLREVLDIFIVIAAWAFGWSIASRIVTHRFFYAFHAIWVSLLFIATMLIDYLSEYIEFMLLLDGTARLIGDSAELVILAVLIYGHLRYASTYSRRRARAVSAASAVIFVALVQLAVFLGQPEFSNEPRYSQVVKPPMFVVHEAQPLGAYFEGLSRKDFAALAEAARE